MRTIISMSLAILLLAGCAQNYIWQHTDKDSYAFNDDAAECDTLAQRARGQAGRDRKGEEHLEFAMNKAYDDTFDKCMKAKGWKKVKE